MYTIHSRPKDDNEDEKNGPNGVISNSQKNRPWRNKQYGVKSCAGCGFPDMLQDGREFCSEGCKNDEENKNTMSIWIWLDWHSGQHYIGCLGQQSYTYASSNDIILAYNYKNMDKNWFFWILNLNNLSPLQFIWIQNYDFPQFKHLADNKIMLKQLAIAIQHKLSLDPSLQIRFKPFAMVQQDGEKLTQNCVEEIKSNIDESKISTENITIACDPAEWAEKFGNKSCLHRFIADMDEKSLFESHGVFEENDEECYGLGLRECRGYVCNNKDEVLAAYDQLTAALGHNNVVIKDCFGQSGDGISFWKSRDDIQDGFVWNDEWLFVNVEEDLRHNEHEIECIEWVGISFYDNKVIGGGHEQIIIDEAVFGGSKTYKNKEIERKLKKIAQKVMKKIGTKFMGGFDFAVQTFKDKNIEPQMYLIDMNTARYTATTQTFIVMKKHDIPDSTYFIRKTVKIKESANFKQITKDVLFNNDTKYGAYFHMFHPPSGDCIVSVFGEDENDVNQRLQRLMEIESLCEQKQ